MGNGWTERIEELEAEVAKLTAERDKLEAEKDKLRDDLSKDKAILQNLLYREHEEKRALEDAMTDLQAERDAAVRWLEEYKSKTYCAYCGAIFNIDSDASHVSEHIRTCPHHPMRELEAENRRLREAVDEGLFLADFVTGNHHIDMCPACKATECCTCCARAAGRFGEKAKQAMKEANHEGG